VPDMLRLELTELHEGYVGRVNRAVAECREDAIRGLSDDYTEEALTLLTGSVGVGADQPGGEPVRRPGRARPRARLLSGIRRRRR
jgi:hypothetical protein